MRNLAVMILQTLMVVGLQSAQAAEPPPAAKPETPVVTPLVEPGELPAVKKTTGSDPVVLDVRTPQEFSAGHVPGAINIPHDQLASRLADLPSSRDKPVVVYCRSGRRAALAEDVLRQNGFSDVRHLKGDMLGWEAEGRPLER